MNEAITSTIVPETLVENKLVNLIWFVPTSYLTPVMTEPLRVARVTLLVLSVAAVMLMGYTILMVEPAGKRREDAIVIVAFPDCWTKLLSGEISTESKVPTVALYVRADRW